LGPGRQRLPDERAQEAVNGREFHSPDPFFGPACQGVAQAPGDEEPFMPLSVAAEGRPAGRLCFDAAAPTAAKNILMKH
jgi:hypothetical protein